MTDHTLTALGLISPAESPDQDLLEITLPMPAWLSTAGEGACDDYREQWVQYHASSTRLEAHLEEVLPSFEAFIHETLTARIKADLGVTLDPDAVEIDLPKRVWRDYDIDPQFGRVKSYAAPWVASTERERFSLPELAKHNFLADDEQMARRFDFARIEQDIPAPFETLTATYLHGLIPRLDVTRAYRAKLRDVFRVPAMDTESGQHHADLLLEPYERQIQLQGLCEFIRRDLSAEGYHLLTLAAQARSRGEADAANLEVNWLLFKPGASVSGEDDSHTLSGLCMIRERTTDRCLIYLPDAPTDPRVIEASSPAHALTRLIQRLLNTPAMIDYLAERTLDTDNVARHVSYINQALARGFEGFIRFMPALDLQPAAQQLHARAWLLHRASQVQAHSKADLDHLRNRQQNAAYFTYLRALLGLLPGIGTLISLEDGWRDVHEAAEAFKNGRGDDGVLALSSAALSVLDVVLSVVPGVVSVVLVSRLGRRAAALHSASSAARSAARGPVLRPFEGYDVQTSLVGAIEQAGRDRGTFLKDGQLWIQRENKAYAVYRRGGEQTLRLKKTPAKGYEPPVRLEDGVWVYHTDVGLRGGVRSTIAESLIAKANGNPAFKSRHARQLLDQFEFPPDRQRRLELDIAVHYQTHRAVPQWAEAYRRPQATLDAAPQPGPSGVKRKDPPAAEGEVQQSSSEPGSSSPAPTLPDPHVGADTWKGWGRVYADADADVRQVQAQPPIFQLVFEPDRRFIKVDAQCYDILPSGASQHPTIVFLKKPDTVDESFSGFNHLLHGNRYEQPIMASFEAGTWTVHGPLFKRKIQLLVEQARPGMTPTTYRILAEKLFEAADHAHEGFTATRLINLRATLNAWQSGQLAPLPGLYDPFLLLERAPMLGVGTMNARVRISYGPARQPFNRLDFTAAEPSLKRLLTELSEISHIGGAGKRKLREFMSAILIHSGYAMVSAPDDILRLRSILLFRRPGQEALYMLKMGFFSTPYAYFRVERLGDAYPLSSRWIDEWLALYPADDALKTVDEARSQGRLVKLVGGVRPNSRLEPRWQVLIQRVEDDY